MYKYQTVIAIIQARMTSSRLPGKVLLPLSGKPVLQHMIERLRRSKYIDSVVVACTENEADQPIIDLCNDLECNYFRGSEEDVLTRVIGASKEFGTDIIVDTTSDCPCVDPELADRMIEMLVKQSKDYVSNVNSKRTFPRGLDLQVLYADILYDIDKKIDNPVDRQHVTTWIYKNPKTYKQFNIGYRKLSEDYSHLRLTIDTKKDYELLQLLFSAFKDNTFNYADIIEFFNKYPELTTYNAEIQQKNYYEELTKTYEV